MTDDNEESRKWMAVESWVGGESRTCYGLVSPHSPFGIPGVRVQKVQADGTFEDVYLTANVISSLRPTDVWEVLVKAGALVFPAHEHADEPGGDHPVWALSLPCGLDRRLESEHGYLYPSRGRISLPVGDGYQPGQLTVTIHGIEWPAEYPALAVLGIKPPRHIIPG